MRRLGTAAHEKYSNSESRELMTVIGFVCQNFEQRSQLIRINYEKRDSRLVEIGTYSEVLLYS